MGDIIVESTPKTLVVRSYPIKIEKKADLAAFYGKIRTWLGVQGVKHCTAGLAEDDNGLSLIVVAPEHHPWEPPDGIPEIEKFLKGHPSVISAVAALRIRLD